MYVGNYRVRPLSFLGLYPDEDLRVGNDLLFRNEHGIFSAVQNEMVEDQGKCAAFVPGFEIDNWTLQEIRFFSSLYLGAGENAPISLYPLPTNQDMFLPEVEVLLNNMGLLRRLMNEETYAFSRKGRPEADARNLNHFEVRPYSDVRFEQAVRFWEALDSEDVPLIRGLHSLLKSEMLVCHYQFLDASLSAVHVALDAAHASVLRRLKCHGGANPSSKDAMAYLEEEMGYPKTGLKFFEDYYDDRIRNFHTDSRFGASPVPDFAVDDIYDLKSQLRSVFFFLVTGELHSDMREERDLFIARPTPPARL
ncbi:hypothetical protein [Pseudophaeobacter sp.]|uniref:hypothetical protein n=1 Tax=Pseudophaeobacter sp. TaxID=1971739 RepID=UPI0032976472